MAKGDEIGPEDSLLALQLRVARRADELARTQAGSSGLNLHCWLLAEREVLRGTLTDWIAAPPTSAISATAETKQPAGV